MNYPCCRCCAWEGCPGGPHPDPCPACGQPERDYAGGDAA